MSGDESWGRTYGEFPCIFTGKPRESLKLKNRLCDYLQIPGEDISDAPPASVGVPLETVLEEDMSEGEIQAKIKSIIALLNKKRCRSSGQGSGGCSPGKGSGST